MFDDRSPIYQQIADKIKGEILHETLHADEQVMSTNQYASFYRINPATAAKAFQQLVDEGILYKKRGIGMFVSPDALKTLLTHRRAGFFTDKIEPIVAEAQLLGIALQDILTYIQQKMMEDEQ